MAVNLTSAVETAKYANEQRSLKRPPFTHWVKRFGPAKFHFGSFGSRGPRGSRFIPTAVSRFTGRLENLPDGRCRAGFRACRLRRFSNRQFLARQTATVNHAKPRNWKVPFTLTSAVETAKYAKYANEQRSLQRPPFTHWVKRFGPAKFHFGSFGSRGPRGSRFIPTAVSRVKPDFFKIQVSAFQHFLTLPMRHTHSAVRLVQPAGGRSALGNVGSSVTLVAADVSPLTRKVFLAGLCGPHFSYCPCSRRVQFPQRAHRQVAGQLSGFQLWDR